MPRAKLTQDEQRRVSLYFELLQRYQNLETGKMLPLVAVRVLFTRRGYNSAVGALERWGEEAVTNFARNELAEMARLWAYMVHNDPPPDAAREQIWHSVTMTRDAAQDPKVNRRIHEFLVRIRIRELWMRSRDNVKPSKVQ